jgi:DNA-binding CsgD family transcriptional regulator
LFVLRRAWVQPGAIDTLSSLFHPPSPQIGFSPSEQRVLVHALLNQSDAEIARRLGLSLDAVKKVWRRIYDRVSRRLPYLVADERKSGRGRSSEKRRHVLEHVRAHPEEVRPTIRSGRENPR